MALRNWAYDTGRFSAKSVAVPVLSVGNLTMGGTGKTPFVEYLANHLLSLGLRPALLSRGYGTASGRNDEAMQLEENLPDVPHLQGRDRAELAEIAIEELEPDLLILDDGFQHRRLARDWNAVLIDATRPPPADYWFPRGSLREPRSALQRADQIIVTRCDQAEPAARQQLRDWLARRHPTILIAEANHSPIELIRQDGQPEPIHTLQGREVIAFCGVGQPKSFAKTLETLGMTVLDWQFFPDHHPYNKADVDKLQQWASRFAETVTVVTTQKDFVKLRLADFSGRPLRAVRVGIELISGEAELQQSLARILGHRLDQDDGPDESAPVASVEGVS